MPVMVKQKIDNWLNAEWAFTKMIAPFLVSVMSAASIALVVLNWNMNSTLVEIKTTIAPLSADVAVIKEKQEKTDGRVTKIELGIEKVKGEISVIKNSITNIREARNERQAN